MSRRETLWLSFELCAAYFVANAALIFAVASAPVVGAIPGLKILPPLAAGLWVGQRRGALPRKPKIVATVALGVFMCVVWSTYTWWSTDIGARGLALLFTAGTLVTLVGATWAYFGMYLMGRKAQRRDSLKR